MMLSFFVRAKKTFSKKPPIRPRYTQINIALYVTIIHMTPQKEEFKENTQRNLQ